MKLISRTLVILGVLALSVAIASSALATDTRRSATSGSFLINTNTDLNAFPHLALDRGGLVELTSGYTDYFAPAAPSVLGSARLVAMLNSNSALVFRANDGAYGMRLMEYAWGYTLSNSGPSMGFPAYFADGQMFDIDWATGSSGGGAFSIGAGVAMVRRFDGTENTAFTVRGSLGMTSGSHLAAEFTFNSPSDAADTDYDSGFGGTVMYRGAFSSGWVLNAAGFISSPAAATADSADTQFGAMVSMGRYLRNSSSGQVGGEIMVDFQTNVPDGISTDGNATYIVVPGFRLGASQMLGSTFEVLGGATAWWTSISREAPSNADFNTRGFAFDYHLGLAAHFGRVTVDTQIHPQALPRLTKVADNENLFGSVSVNVAL